MERKFEYKKRCLIREIEEILVFHVSSKNNHDDHSIFFVNGVEMFVKMLLI